MYEEFLTRLTDIFPQECREGNQARLYPLHMTCQTYKCIRTIIDVFPHASREPDIPEMYMYPLHMPCQNRNVS